MNAEERIRELARRSKREPAPRVDVVAAVMARVCRPPAEAAAPSWPLAWAVAVAAAVALPIALGGALAWRALSDPLVQLVWLATGGGL